MSEPRRLSPLEVVSGIVSGPEPGVAALPDAPAPPSIAALEDAIRPALTRPPCLVAFSGGRDSSAVLAVAARLAGREGWDPPVPATNRFPAVASAAESDWQEMVVRHLGLSDWLRLDHGDELDAVGPIATRLLRQRGLLWPFNSHFLAPLAAAAAGGSVLTGVGGDELFSWPWAGALALSMLRGSTRASLRRAGYVALVAGPWTLRRTVYRRRSAPLPWLRPEGERAVLDDLAGWDASAPRRFDRCLREWWWPGRYLQLGRHSLAAVGASHGATVVHPLADPGFLVALGREHGWRGFGSRSEAMVRLFGALLPAEMLTRATKAGFTGAFVNRHSRAFVREWSGEGVPAELVDVEALRRTWSAPEPDGRSLLLLQAAWLACHPVAPAGRSAGDLGSPDPLPRRPPGA